MAGKYSFTVPCHICENVKFCQVLAVSHIWEKLRFSEVALRLYMGKPQVFTGYIVTCFFVAVWYIIPAELVAVHDPLFEGRDGVSALFFCPFWSLLKKSQVFSGRAAGLYREKLQHFSTHQTDVF